MHYPKRVNAILTPQNARERLIYRNGYQTARKHRGAMLIVHGSILTVTAGLVFMNTFFPL